MKVTKRRLKKIIKEEISKVLKERGMQDPTGSGLNVPPGWFDEPAPAKWCAEGYKGNLCGDISFEEYLNNISWIDHENQLKIVMPTLLLYRAKKLSPEGAKKLTARSEGYRSLIELAFALAEREEKGIHGMALKDLDPDSKERAEKVLAQLDGPVGGTREARAVLAAKQKNPNFSHEQLRGMVRYGRYGALVDAITNGTRWYKDVDNQIKKIMMQGDE